MIEINEYFKSEYLTCGRTRDNFLFENCPREFVAEGSRLLIVPNEDVKPCTMMLTAAMEWKFNKAVKACESDYQKSILARGLICSMIMVDLLKYNSGETERKLKLFKDIRLMLSGDFDKMKEGYAGSPMPYEISQMARKMGNVELNIFLTDTRNKFLQQAINNFISSREPYSIKVFTTDKRLPTYYDQMGNLIQSPHDYMTMDINQYVTIRESGVTK